MDIENEKVGLSMKYVDQETGKDLDPLQVSSHQILQVVAVTASAEPSVAVGGVHETPAAGGS